MTIELISTAAAMAHTATDWDRLTRRVPFRSFSWLDAWWRHYGDCPTGRGETQSRRLCALAVRDSGGKLIGLAPWFVEQTLAAGRVLKFLGSGETYSDYLSIFAAPGLETVVASDIANWLADEFAGQWDALEFTGVDAADLAVQRLITEIEGRGIRVFRRPDLNCWRIDLPPTWNGYLAMLSKSHRKQVRRMERRLLTSGRATVQCAEGTRQVEWATKLLMQLHQTWHQHRGRAGAFSSTEFCAFHRDVIPRLVREGNARLNVVRVDGRPIAVEYLLLGSDVVYAYQSGIDRDYLAIEPGRLSNAVAIRQAIEQGYRAFDFLRGDEPYKAHWRATPRATLRARAVPPSRVSRARNALWLAQDTTKEWFKQHLFLRRHSSQRRTWPAVK